MILHIPVYKLGSRLNHFKPMIEASLAKGTLGRMSYLDIETGLLTGAYDFWIKRRKDQEEADYFFITYDAIYENHNGIELFLLGGDIRSPESFRKDVANWENRLRKEGYNSISLTARS